MEVRAKHLVSSLIVALAAASSVKAGQVFSYSGSIQTYTVPSTGIYGLSVSGAQGGGEVSYSIGGLGASVSGDVSLTQGTVLDIVVGGKCATGYVAEGFGGGGGSFVYVGGSPQPLAVAGGGGGASPTLNSNGGPGQNGTSGQPGFDPEYNSYGGSAGISGSGGGGGMWFESPDNGGGGGGWLGNGGNGIVGSGFGGDGPVLFSGGAGDSQITAGGFGGGGGGGYLAGGGGGGYSGGGGGAGVTNNSTIFGGGGGGGGSYLGSSFTNTRERAGYNSGNGEVSISQVVPEPGTLALLCAGGAALLAGCGWRTRRRR